ncbi:MAG: hypothetical protein UX44_C0016G0010 [candidate division WWE3 bacterium GW2011_GWA1_46_21]|uniref:Phosphomannomutase n=4 Tax=Katanobacteria TaxID=422282 RepID=A0A0G1PD52_UNCKA|nr:MAG: hypothetical protein UX44_C0016G0010 [candidate division WWE3 bacterium GW2011_GWA1_46_21]KKU48399.1 MAG: hypothetical protein UX69_C0017G0011 [candidate division WWE3 bacterium GW2011_GWA2_46_9]KKU50941.1 MAG: hypothetical protein UX73_C0011G0011 [candidate division WWE3 bacterium GW2011_GWC1_47_10]KKU57447.1 MAG: hypothetical protein UX79_C0011G0011 [candidate division WWE3 bacterium GW2011_GWB1_47_11]
MKLPATIFRAYDIRGEYPDELGEKSIELIGKAFGTFLQEKFVSSLTDAVCNAPTVAVGMDDRKSSPALARAFIAGVTSTGCAVLDVGLSMTPIIHFVCCTQNVTAGVMVTASHNPKQYNGLRLDYASAVPFYGDDIQSLYELVEQGKFERRFGKCAKQDVFPLYLHFLGKKFSFAGGPKIVVHCGSGTTSAFAPEIFSKLGCAVVSRECLLNANFPNGVPNPENREFMKKLSSAVVAEKAFLGVAFDTDADRLGVVDEKGAIYDADKLLLLFAHDLLTRKKGVKVVYDVKSTGLLNQLVSGWGGSPQMIRTGHPYFVSAMKSGAVLGGEFSGHLYFGDDYFGYDDGIYAACRLIDLVLRKGIPLSELVAAYPKRYHTSEITILCPDEGKADVIAVLESATNFDFNFVSVSTIDGIRVQVTESGWFLVRASNTSPYLSVRVEGKDEAEARLMLSYVAKLLSHRKSINLENLNAAEFYES